MSSVSPLCQPALGVPPQQASDATQLPQSSLDANEASAQMVTGGAGLSLQLSKRETKSLPPGFSAQRPHLPSESGPLSIPICTLQESARIGGSVEAEDGNAGDVDLKDGDLFDICAGPSSAQPSMAIAGSPSVEKAAISPEDGRPSRRGSALSNAETREPSLASSSGVRGSSQDMASRIHEICNLGKKVALHTQGNPTRSLSEPLGTMIMGETSPGGPKCGVQLKAKLDYKPSGNTDVILKIEPAIPRYLSRNMEILTTPYTLQVSVRKVNKQEERFTRQFLLKDGCLMCKAFSWERQQNQREFYISIMVTYEDLVTTERQGYITVESSTVAV